MRLLKIFLTAFLVLFSILSCYATIPAVPRKNEIVMSEGMKIKVVNNAGILTITAGRGLQRFYMWNDGTRSVIMWPREERWRGSLGLYFPGPGNH